ncbi:glutamate-1-semialdehyde 2,1-aminomutase [Gammaproteobacteria bacterium]|nr:glutamate-1-semialdehyde 2,1-aminomutase [Gammaproteobacteria bacterium]
MDIEQIAKQYLVGGVNSPVRSLKGLVPKGLFIEKADGPYLYANQKSYLDLVCGFGPHILGHQHPTVRQALQSAIDQGFCPGATQAAEVKLAQHICQKIPSMECLRLVNSGTEAAITAVRLARAITGRSAILKFAGGYHGHLDSCLVSAGSGAMTCGTPSSPGVLAAVAKQTFVVPYNDLAAAQQVMQSHGQQIAAVLVEPVAGNMGCIPPAEGFLSGLRQLCDQTGSMLVFDEVMTGFRVHQYAAQVRYNITPDLTLLGKIIGGGLPIGALGGKREYLNRLAPVGDVYQAGTFSGHALSCAAGLAVLQYMQSHQVIDVIERRVQHWLAELGALAKRYGVPMQTSQVGGMFGAFFTEQPVLQLADIDQASVLRFKAWFKACLDNGIYWPPSAYEAGFVSYVHDEAVLDASLVPLAKVFKQLTYA